MLCLLCLLSPTGCLIPCAAPGLLCWGTSGRVEGFDKCPDALITAHTSSWIPQLGLPSWPFLLPTSPPSTGVPSVLVPSLLGRAVSCWVLSFSFGPGFWLLALLGSRVFVWSPCPRLLLPFWVGAPPVSHGLPFSFERGGGSDLVTVFPEVPSYSMWLLSGVELCDLHS